VRKTFSTFATLASLILAAGLAGGCGKSESKPNTVTTNGSGQSGVGIGTGAVVPTGPGKPIDKPILEAITKLPFGGGEIKVLTVEDDLMSMTITPKGVTPERRSRLTISKCLNCVPMDKAKWEERRSELLQLVPAELRDKPDLVYEIGETTIAGHEVIYVYQAGVHVTPGDTQTVSHAYTINWNDGVNQLHIVAYDASVPSSMTVEHLVTLVPRAQLETLAAATFTEAINKLDAR
jgi:hypothetical protein